MSNRPSFAGVAVRSVPLKNASGGVSSRHPERRSERAITWRFQRSTAGEWRWERTTQHEGFTLRSSRAFGSYEDCVRDALKAGYTPLMSSSNLVSLSLSAKDPDVPDLLDFGPLPEFAGRVRHSPVLKKRIAHPAIERIFGKPRTAAVTRARAQNSKRREARPLNDHQPGRDTSGKGKRG